MVLKETSPTIYEDVVEKKQNYFSFIPLYEEEKQYINDNNNVIYYCANGKNNYISLLRRVYTKYNPTDKVKYTPSELNEKLIDIPLE